MLPGQLLCVHVAAWLSVSGVLLQASTKSSGYINANVSIYLNESCVSQVDRAKAAYQDFRLHDALEAALVISNRGNLYMEEVAPWTAFKKGSDAEKDAAAAALVAVLEAVRIVAVMMSPVTPGLSSRIYAGLGMNSEQFERLRWGDVQWGGLPNGQTMPKPLPVFARIEADPVNDVSVSAVSMAAQ